MRKISILSAAHIHTKGFIESIVKEKLFEIAAIYDDVPSRGEAYAKQAGGRFESSREKILQDSSIEGIIITSENTSKQPLLLDAIRAGKAILCEKPVALSAGQASEIREALKAHPRTRLVSGYYMPYGAQGRTLKHFLASGKLGKPLSIQYRNCHMGAFGRWFDNPDLAWFTRKDQAAGGGFLDLGTHAIHYLAWLFGPGEKVSAMIENQAGLYPDVDDTGRALIKFKNGVLAGVEAGWISHSGTNAFLLTGERGYVQQSGDNLEFTPAGGKAEILPAKEGAPSGVKRLASLLEGKIPEAEWRGDVESFLDAAVIMEACYKSQEEGRCIKI